MSKPVCGPGAKKPQPTSFIFDNGFDPVLGWPYPPVDYMLTIGTGFVLNWTIPDVTGRGTFYLTNLSDPITAVLFWRGFDNNPAHAAGPFTLGHVPLNQTVHNFNYIWISFDTNIAHCVVCAEPIPANTGYIYWDGAAIHFAGPPPSDAISHFVLERSNTGSVNGGVDNNGFLTGTITTLSSSIAAADRSYVDLTTSGNQSYFYRLTGVTNSGFQFPYNVVSAVPAGGPWSSYFGATPNSNDGAGAIKAAQDSSGNVVIAGSFTGDKNNFPPSSTFVSNHGASNTQDFFIAKFDKYGANMWAKSFGGTSNDSCTSMAMDSVGNVVIVGAFSGTLDFGGTILTSAETTSMYVAKYSTSGLAPVLMWVHQYLGAQNAQGVAIDSSDNIIITGGYGYYGTSVNFGGGTLPGGLAGSYAVYIVKFSSAGIHVWSHGYGTSGLNVGYSAAVGTDGSVHVSGAFAGTINFGGSTLTSHGLLDAFVVKFDSTGVHQWSKSFGAASNDYAYGVAVGSNGNVSVTGVVQNPAGTSFTVDFGGGPVSIGVSFAAFLVSYDTTGAFLFVKTIEPIYGGQGTGVAVDSLGNIYMVGSSTGLANYGNGSYEGGGTSNFFMVKYDVTGVYQSHTVKGGSGNSASSISIAAGNSPYATGSFATTLDFGPMVPGSPMVSPGSLCGFVYKVT